MQEILKIIIVSGFTWFLVYSFLYSPKAQIKKLKKSMFLYKGIDYKKELEVQKISGVPSKFIELDKKTQKLINALIDEYLDSESDSEFIEKYKDEQFTI